MYMKNIITTAAVISVIAGIAAAAAALIRGNRLEV